MERSLGIIGGGQLGRMLTIAAKQMGFRVVVIDPTPGSPAGQVADKQIVADFQDASAILSLGKEVPLITFEIELANAEALSELVARGMCVYPSGETLMIIQDKWRQKEFLRKMGVPIAESVLVEETEEALLGALDRFRTPMVVKARFGGYDGRGNAVVRTPDEIPGALLKLEGRSLYAERHVVFVRELAVIAARSTSGEIAVYPSVETIQENNICHVVIAPAPVRDVRVLLLAQELAKEVMAHLNGVGVFGIEMFETADGEVLVNEIAPRVHNSGHFTIEGCKTSQFTQHIRAITGLPLGSPDMTVSVAVMINILGARSGKAQVSGLSAATKYPGVFVHLYGKHQVRPERKMGHVTALGENVQETTQRAKAARAAISI